MKASKLRAQLLFAFCIFTSLTAVNADVPPDPGFKRISLKLILAPQDDFPEYRFFIKSGADLEEIVLKKGERRSIEPLGGGAWYRLGEFVAVPKKSLEGLGEERSGGNLSKMQKLVYDGKVPGMIELVDHGFVREVREADAGRWEDAVYNIEKDAEKGLRAVLVSGGEPERSTDPPMGLGYSREPKTGEFWVTVIGGSLMTLAFIALGAWFIRRLKVREIK